MAVKNCPHPELSGYRTVEVVLHFCEVGEECEGLKVGCPFAFPASNHKASVEAYEQFCKEIAEGRHA